MAPVASNEKARLLRSYYDDGGLVLPNAWDAASAVLLAGLGARAIATTSAGVAWSRGLPDGEHISRADMVQAVEGIAGAVAVPVTADVEAGYGPAPADVAATVEAVLRAGAVGINLEDSQAVGGPLFSPEEHARRVEAAVRTAAGAGVGDFVVNARTDVFLFAIGEPAGRLDDVIGRAKAYAEAGAASLFVPGLLDLEALGALTAVTPLPVNALAMPGGPTVAELLAAGVRRVSVGAAFAQVAYAAARRAAREMLDEGTFGALDDALGFAELDGLFSAPSAG